MEHREPTIRLRDFKIGDRVRLIGAESGPRQIKGNDSMSKPLTVMDIDEDGYYHLFRDENRFYEGLLWDHYASPDHLAEKAK